MSASPPTREEIARIAYEAWLSVGEGKPGWVSWDDFPLVSPEDYEACLTIADRILDRLNATKPRTIFAPTFSVLS